MTKLTPEIVAFIKELAAVTDGRPTASRAMRLNDFIAKARAINEQLGQQAAAPPVEQMRDLLKDCSQSFKCHNLEFRLSERIDAALAVAPPRQPIANLFAEFEAWWAEQPEGFDLLLSPYDFAIKAFWAGHSASCGAVAPPPVGSWTDDQIWTVAKAMHEENRLQQCAQCLAEGYKPPDYPQFQFWDELDEPTHQYMFDLTKKSLAALSTPPVQPEK